MSGQSLTSIFSFSLSLGKRSLHFFVVEGSQTRPQCAAVHSSFGTEKKIAAFPNIAELIFLFVQCSKYAGVDVSTVVNRRKAVCEQIQRERLSFSGNSGQDRAYISSDPNLACKGVTETILDGMHRHIPNKRLTTRPSDPSWWTPECTAAVQAKRRSWDRLHKYPSKENEDLYKTALCPVRCMPSQCKGTWTGRCSTTP